MIQARLPDGRILQFPDGTDPAVVQATVKRMVGQGGASPPPLSTPLSESVAGSFFANTFPAMEEKRAEMADIAERGDIGDRPFHAEPSRQPAPPPSLQPSHAPSPLAAKRAEVEEIRETGDLGTEDFTDVAEPGWMPEYSRQGISQRSLRDTVLNNSFGWVIGGAERAGLLPEGTRAAVRENQQESFDRYLTAHPEGGLGRVVGLTVGDVGASMAGPQVLLGRGAGVLASQGAARLGAKSGLRILAGLGGGAAEGAGQQALDVIDIPPEERALMITIGAGLGSLSALRGLAAEARHAAAPKPPPPEVRQQLLSAFDLDKSLVAERAAAAGDPKVVAKAVGEIEAKWQPEFAQGGAAGDPVMAQLADRLQGHVAPEVKAPPPVEAMAHAGSDVSPEAISRVARGERYVRISPGGEVVPILNDVAAVDVRVNPGEVKAVVGADGVPRIEQGRPNAAQQRALGRLQVEPQAVETASVRGPEPTAYDIPEVVDPETLALAGINPEAGFLGLGRNKPPAPPPSPIEAVMPRNEPTPAPAGPLGRLQAAADRVTDQWFNREDAPVRRLRRAGLTREAKYLEDMQARARGAGGMQDPQRQAGPVYEGTYVFDPNLDGPGKFGSRRTGDGLQAIVGGMDDQALYDLDGLLAARRHMELVGRQERAKLQYDWQRAQRLEEMRVARRTDKAALRSMFGDIRSARAEELKAVRGLSAAQMEARVRDGIANQESVRASDLNRRATGARAGALDSAVASADAGAELAGATAQTRSAALAARQLLRQELRAAVRTPRPGEIPPLDLQAGPRSPAAVHEADQMALALRRVAERVGVAEGSLHELLERAGELETLGRQAGRSSAAQAGRAGQAWSRVGSAAPDAALARQQAGRTIASAQRVAMGIRDAATRRIPPVERPPDIDLNIDPRGTSAAQQTLADLEARYGTEPHPTTGAPQIRQLDALAERFRDWTVRAWMIPLKEAGRFSDAEFTYHQNPDGSFTYGGDIIAKNDLYAPFLRLMEVLGDEDVYGLSPVTSGKPNPIHAITGGLSPDAPVARPVQSAVELAQKATLWVERQRVRNLFGDAVDSSPELQLEVRKLSPQGGAGTGPKTGLPIHVRGDFPVWRDGVRTNYTAPPDVLRAVETLSPKQAKPIMEAAKLAARMLRAGATITLEFPFRNLGRDVQDAAVYGPGYNPALKILVDPFAGLLEVLGQGKWAKEWRTNGGALSGAVAVGRPQIEATLRDVARGRPASLGAKIGRRYRGEIGGEFSAALKERPATTLMKTGLFPFMAPMEALAEQLESATKVGAYRRMRLRGMSPGEAVTVSRDVSSPDFGRAGSTGQVWNQVESFSNAELQDLYRLGRAFRRNPGTTTIKALTYLTLPAIANWYKNKDDEQYQALPEWERVAFYHPVKLDAGRWVRIPRPLGLINLAWSYGPQKLLEKMAGDDPDAIEELGRAFVHGTPLHYLPQMENLRGGGRMDWVPTIAQPLAEVAGGPAGWSSFREAPIDTTAMFPDAAPLPEDRVRDRTSGIARAAGKALNVSPIKVDYLLQGYGAFWGRTLAQATGPLARGLGADPTQDTLAGRMAQGGSPQLPTTAADIPGVRGFVSSQAIGFGSDPVTKLYTLSTEAAQAKKSMKDARDAGDINRYLALMREHPEIGLADVLYADRKYLSEIRKRRNEILNSPGLDPEQREDLLISLDQLVSAYAGARLHGYSDILHDMREGK